jgi:hypothetical protein
MTTATATRLFDNIIEFPSLTQEGGKSNEWFTPARYIKAAREVMGGIDLDPASCAMANQTVKASRYYSIEDDGLKQEWYGNVWLNPPYGQDKSLPNEWRSTIARWVKRLVSEYQNGNIRQGILLSTTQTDGAWFQPLWEYPICFASHVVQFTCLVPNKNRWNGKAAHRNGTIFVYLGPNEQKFIEVFSQFGRIAKAIDTPHQTVVPLSLWEEV